MPETQGQAPSLSEIIDDLGLRFILSCPDEDFKDSDRLMFQFELAHWFYQDEYLDKYPDDLPTLSFSQFCAEVFRHFPILNQYADSVREQIASFNKYKNQVPVCGCLLLNKNMTKVLMIQGFGAKSWNFPRGKINQGETHMECAIRETREEIGYCASPDEIDENKFIETTSGKKKIKLFIIENVDESTNFQTQTVKEINKIAWQNIASLSPNQNKYRNVWPIIQKLKQWIRKVKKERRSSPRQSRDKNASSSVNNNKVSSNRNEKPDSKVSSENRSTSSDIRRSKAKSQSPPSRRNDRYKSMDKYDRNEKYETGEGEKNDRNSKRRQKSRSDNSIRKKDYTPHHHTNHPRISIEAPAQPTSFSVPTSIPNSIPVSPGFTVPSFQKFTFNAEEMMKAIRG